MSTEEKISLIKKAIREKRKLKIVYLKSTDEKSCRIILPKRVYETKYNGYSFIAIEAYCFLREQQRNFNLKRILEIDVINS